MAYRRAAGRAEAAAQQKAARKAEQASISSPISPISPDEKKTNMSSSTESAPPSPEEDDLPVIRPGLSKAVSMKDDKLTLDDGTSVEIKVNLSDVNPVAAVGAVVRKPNNLFISLYTGLLFGVSYCQLYTVRPPFSPGRRIALILAQGGITFAQAPYSYDPLIVGLVLCVPRLRVATMTTSSSHRLAYGGGTILGSVAGGRYSDRTWARLKAQNGGKGEPEVRPFHSLTENLRSQSRTDAH